MTPVSDYMRVPKAAVRGCQASCRFLRDGFVTHAQCSGLLRDVCEERHLAREVGKRTAAIIEFVLLHLFPPSYACPVDI